MQIRTSFTKFACLFVFIAFFSTAGSAASINSKRTSSAGLGPILSVSPAAVFCGSVMVGGGGQCQSLTLTNTGDATLNFRNVLEQKIRTRGGFSLNGCVVVSLAPGESCTWTIDFFPEAKGYIQAWYFVINNGPKEVVLVKLTGTGVAQP